MEITEFKEFQKRVKSEGKELVVSLMKGFLDRHPKVDALGWVQYTPYFNDGDPCYFMRDRVTVRLVAQKEEQEGDVDENNIDESFIGSWSLRDTNDSSLKAIGEELEKLNSDLSKDFDPIFESAFGEHVTVICTRDGFNITEYIHD